MAVYHVQIRLMVAVPNEADLPSVVRELLNCEIGFEYCREDEATPDLYQVRPLHHIGRVPKKGK